MNISMLLDMATDAFGERTAVVGEDTALTYTELRDKARAAAGEFRAAGVQHVALLDTNSAALPVALFGAAYAGIPYVPINYRLTAKQINALVARVAPALLLVGDAYRDVIEPRAGVQQRASRALLDLPAGSYIPAAEGDPNDVAVQLFTSGTTGAPKAALLRHEHLVSYIVGTVEFGAAEEDEAVLVTMPPYHIAGIAAVLSSTYAGRRMVVIANFDAGAWLAAARRERVTHAFVVPTMLTRIVAYLDDHAQAPELPALRALAYGGGKMPRATIERAMALFGDIDFTNAYGLTETSSTVAVLTPDDHRAAASDEPALARRLSSVGQPTAAIELDIRDDAGHSLPAGAPGTIYVRGGQVAGEYREQDSQIDADGWFCTRDLGFVDDAGYLFLSGRADDVIVRGGENISPGEIEDVLLAHPAVADVAVVAAPDEQWGEAVAAAVVRADGAAVAAGDLRDWVGQRLRSSRVPRTIVFKNALPYNDLGKVLRRVIRQEFADRTSLSTAGWRRRCGR